METPKKWAGPQMPPYVVEPISQHTHTMILLHGLGSNGKKFGTELLETGLSATGKSLSKLLPGTRFIFPTAKRRRSSAFKRSKLTQWFDIASLDDPSYNSDVQVQGLEESTKYLQSLLEQELELIPAENITLGGISQGCAMGLITLLSLDFPLGGFIGISGFLPFREHIEVEDADFHFKFDDAGAYHHVIPAVEAKKSVRLNLHLNESDRSEDSDGKSSVATPIFLGHGEDDEKIKCELGQEAKRALSSIGYEVTWRAYPGLGHWYKIPDEIDDILEFLGNNAGLEQISSNGGWISQLVHGLTFGIFERYL